MNFKEPLFSLFEGTSANIPLDLLENHPLAYIPPLAPTALWLCELRDILAFSFCDILDSAGREMLKGRDNSLKSSWY